MAKKCTMCGDSAKFRIKDTSDFYCKECAEESFSDISVLKKVENDAKKIKKIVEDYGNKYLIDDDSEKLDEND